MNSLHEWAKRHNIPTEAMAELCATLTATCATDAAPTKGGDEAGVQAAVRLEASRKGWLLFRNNVGAGKLDNGSFIRWGLANDSAALNAKCKSADLVGLRPLLVTADMVGRTVGQFASVECKRPGWKYRGGDREAAQLRWLEAIQANGGHARFVTGTGEI